MSFTVAVVGRPNVGKSTLFNRLVGRRLAIVHDQPGVTRDRRTATADLAGLRFTVIDTAGLEEAGPETLEGRMRAQTEAALDAADVALFLIDARAGVTPIDEHFADLLRRRNTPVIVVANKCEGRPGEAGFLEAWGLGLGEPVAISAEHGEGMADLFEALYPHALAAGAEGAVTAEADAAGEPSPEPEEGEEVVIPERPDRPLQLAIAGRPNTGKSTLVNALIGEDRLVTGPEAGLTRDSIPVDWDWEGRAVRLVDTAGLRRKSRVERRGLERLSVAGTLDAIRMAEVVVLVLDADQVMERQDLTIARMVIEEGRALVIAVNKWDAAADRGATIRRLKDRLQTSLPQVRGIPYVTISALAGRGLDRLMAAVFDAHAVWNARVTTGQLNRWLEAATAAHPPPLAKSKRRIKLRYMTQVKARPPTFALFVSVPEELPEAYLRYLANGLRDDFGLPGAPIRILTRKPKNPYAPD